MKILRRKDPTTEIDDKLSSKRTRREQLGRELDLTRGQLHDLTERRVAALAGDAAAGATIGALGREISDVTSHAEALAQALARVDADLAQLEIDRTTALRHQALRALRSEIEAYAAAGARVDDAWRTVLPQLADLAEREKDIDALAHQLGLPLGFHDDRALARVMLWRLADHAPMPGGNHFFPPDDRVSVEAFIDRRCHGLLEMIDKEVSA